MITIKNLSKSYGNSPVLKNINLSFEKGNVYGIVGENGAGKTTLFRCVAGLESYEGEVVSINKNLKDHLGFLATEPFLFSRITGLEYIRLLCNARQLASVDVEKNNLFELPLNQYASSYSTGMKKKLALTAVLLQQNDVFILDEPFNGVDIQSNLIISELIKRLKNAGKTLIISSHIFSTLADNCDKIFLLKEGSITKEVFKKDFEKLESEMLDFTLGTRLNNFKIN